MFILLFVSMAMADTTVPPEPGPVAVVQASPGVHLTLSRGKLGVGASVDLLGGVVFGDREFNLAPGVVAGPFVELNAVLKQGLNVTVGGRAGGGALAPTARVGFVPYGMAAVDYGRSFGALDGARMGLHLRALYGGLGASRHADGGWGFTVGPELPILPAPVVY